MLQTTEKNGKQRYQRNLLLPSLKMLSDIIAVEVAVLMAYFLRFYSPLASVFPVTKGIPPFKTYFIFSFFLSLTMLLLFNYFNAYRSRYFSSLNQDLITIFRACFIGILVAMSGAFLYREVSYSRLVFGLIFINTNLMLIITRYLFHRLKKVLLQKGFNTIEVVLVGTKENLKRVLNGVEREESIHFKPVGYISDNEADLDIPYLGNLDTIDQLMERGPSFSGMIISLGYQQHARVLDLMAATEGKNLELFYVPDVLDILTARFESLEVGGIPVLQLKTVLLAGWQGFIKRSFDVVVSFIALLCLSPILIVTAFLVKVSSPGPIFYRQKRVGLDGIEFEMIKFRSMRTDAEDKSGPVWSVPGDPRTTPVGKFLRRSSLDELPQLLNVLSGEMSLVGPRPERRHFVDQFREYVPKYLERHRLRSGMTGWAQVNGMRGQSSIEDRTRYDLFYIENWSIWFDLRILLMTVAAVIRGDNAY